jgi:hypothetical protein
LKNPLLSVRLRLNELVARGCTALEVEIVTMDVVLGGAFSESVKDAALPVAVARDLLRLVVKSTSLSGPSCRLRWPILLAQVALAQHTKRLVTNHARSADRCMAERVDVNALKRIGVNEERSMQLLNTLSSLSEAGRASNGVTGVH